MTLYVTYHVSLNGSMGFGAANVHNLAAPRSPEEIELLREVIFTKGNLKESGVDSILILSWVELPGAPLPAETEFYLIYGSDADGESIDTVVEAGSTEEAEKLWREWCDENGFEPDEKDFTIYRLPAKRNKPCALDWGDQAGVVLMKDTRR